MAYVVNMHHAFLLCMTPNEFDISSDDFMDPSFHCYVTALMEKMEKIKETYLMRWNEIPV